MARLDQLAACGLGASAVRDRVRSGRLYRIHRGVYSLVPRGQLGRRGLYLAAVLACGPGAVLSHRSAAALWGIRKSGSTAIEVITAGRRGRKIDGVGVHTARTLAPADVTQVVRAGTGSRAPVREVHSGEHAAAIPVTSVSRTILDLAGVLDRRGVKQATEQATILELLDLRASDELLARNPYAPGINTVRELLAELSPDPTGQTDDGIETAFAEICRNARLPPPEIKQLLTLPTGDTFEPDFMWRAQRVIVETDGARTHLTPQAFQADRTRDQLLSIFGWRVVRFTWRDVFERSAHVAATLRALLSGS